MCLKLTIEESVFIVGDKMGKVEENINPFEKEDEMILITDIKIETHSSDQIILHNCGLYTHPDKVKRELVYGRRFRRPSDGMDVVIGVPKELADIIGIQYEAWEEKEKLITSLQETVTRYSNNILHLVKQNFWQRLKWFFASKKKRYSLIPF